MQQQLQQPWDAAGTGFGIGPGPGGAQMAPQDSVKQRLMNLIQAVRTLMRSTPWGFHEGIVME